MKLDNNSLQRQQKLFDAVKFAYLYDLQRYHVAQTVYDGIIKNNEELCRDSDACRLGPKMAVVGAMIN